MGCSQSEENEDLLDSGEIKKDPIYIYLKSPATFLGSSVVGNVLDYTFTFKLKGGVPVKNFKVKISGEYFSFKGGSFPGRGGTCKRKMKPGRTCSIKLSYAPLELGSHPGTIRYSYYNGTSNRTKRKAIRAESFPILVYSVGSTYNYGSKFTETSNDLTVTVTNEGLLSHATDMSALALTVPYTFKDGTYPGTGGTCGTRLNIGATCIVVINYTPITNGAHTDRLTFRYTNDGNSEDSYLDFSAWGLYPAELTVSDVGNHDFGIRATGGTWNKVYTVTYVAGDVPATGLTTDSLTLPFKYIGGSFPGTSGTCGTTISSGTCTFVVSFVPTVDGENWNEVVSFDYHSGRNPETITGRDLDAKSVPAPVLTVDNVAPHEFGTIHTGNTVDLTYTVDFDVSEGDPRLDALSLGASGIAAPFIYKGGSYPGVGGDCGNSLSQGDNCTIVVQYAPTTANDDWTDTLNISYFNDINTITESRILQGDTEGQLDFTAGATYDFGDRPVGSSITYTLTLRSVGGLDATAITGEALSAPFSYTGGSYPGGGTCSGTLSEGDTCTIKIDYDPGSYVLHTDTLTINFHNILSADSIDLNLTGTGVTEANLSISEAGTYNFGTVARGSTTEKEFTISNSGGFVATSITGSGLAAPYTFKGGSYPGTDGTCGTSIAASADCTVFVTLNPSANGTPNDTMNIDYFDGLINPQVSKILQSTVVNPAELTISESDVYDFGVGFLNVGKDKSFTLTHSGGVPATSIGGSGLGAPFIYKGGTFPGTGGDCGLNLSSGTCTFIVTFTATSLGSHNSSMTVSYNDGANGQTDTRDITGTGHNPAVLAISESNTYNFGSVIIGNSVDKTFTITNSGTVNATGLSGTGLAAPFSYKGGSFPGTGGSCTGPITPGTCTFIVTYTPTASGSLSDTIQINYTDGQVGASVTRSIEGTGVDPASLSISPTSFDFGTVANGSSTDKSFTISNSGETQASSITGTGLGAPFLFKGGSGYPGAGGDCGLTLAASANCTIVVTLNPSATGTPSDTILIDYNNGFESQQETAALDATVVDPALLTLSESDAYDYGSQFLNISTDKSFTLTYSGGVPATSIAGSGLNAPYIYKGGSFPGTGGSCTSPTLSSGTCTIIVTYTPTSSGNHNDTMILSYDDGANGQTVTRDLTGIGLAPAVLAISESDNYNLGSVVIGNSVDKSFTITNSGTVDATTVTGIGLAAPFIFKGGSGYPGVGGDCTDTISPGTCTIIVTYTPTASGLLSDTIQINYTDGQAGANATRSIEGTGLDPASLSISPTSFDFGTVARDSSTDKSFTISNSGEAQANSITGTGLIAPFTFKGGSGYPGAGGDCGVTIAASANCIIVVTLNPSANGSPSDTILIDYNDGFESQQETVVLDATVVDPALLTLSESDAYDFNIQTIGSATDHTFTITHSGGVSATSIVDVELTSSYFFKGGDYPGTGGDCGAQLDSDTCTIVLTYSPSSSGDHDDSITIDYHNGVSSVQVIRNVTGEGQMLTTSQTLFSLMNPQSIDINIVNVDADFKSELVAQNYTNVTVGDTNADSINEYLVSNPHFDTGGGVYRGVVNVYDGSADSLLFGLQGDETGDFFGGSMNGMGDIDSDGKDDFLIGAPTSNNLGNKQGKVYSFSGVDGTLSYSLEGQNNNSYFGLSTHNVGDIDSDGVDDFLVGEYFDNGSDLILNKIYGYSGVDGSFIFDLDKE